MNRAQVLGVALVALIMSCGVGALYLVERDRQEWVEERAEREEEQERTSASTALVFAEMAKGCTSRAVVVGDPGIFGGVMWSVTVPGVDGRVPVPPLHTAGIDMEKFLNRTYGDRGILRVRWSRALGCR